MIYQILTTSRFDKELLRLDVRYRQKIENAIEDLAINPLLGKKLNDNLKKYRSVREGVYRIIYEVKKEKLIIIVITVQHRQGVYRKI